MAKFFENEKRRKRALVAVSALLAASLALGTLAACTSTTEPNEEDDAAATPTDTQIIKNGNFEFYAEATEKDKKERLNLISTPTSWSFSSGSPSSDTRSGVIDTSLWTYMSAQGSVLNGIDDAVARWDSDTVNAYDRLKFYKDYEKEIDELETDSEASELFAKYNYSIDYEDVQYLAEELGSELKLHEGAKEDETGVLMIHNRRTSDNVLGTAQYYTSSTTVTVKAGTAAKVSVWVRTDKLTHYYEENKDPVTKEGGAYIGLTNTVGGTTLDQMLLKNINTDGAWQQYTFYVRANTFATSTFRVVLGLGRGNSDNRLEAVNGYAFFDDVECKVISAATYESEIEDLDEKFICKLDDTKEDKEFNLSEEGRVSTVYALDLLEEEGVGNTDYSLSGITNVDLTEDVDYAGWTSDRKGYPDNREDASVDAKSRNIAKLTTYSEIAASDNGWLSPIYKNDFNEKFPFLNSDGEVDTNKEVLLLLSGNGAAYTAKVEPTDTSFTLQADEYLLVSFFVKTSEIMSGRSGAGAILIDELDNRTTISAFDTTKIDTVDIDDDETDIYKGWVQCFFFVANETDREHHFTLQFTYGPTDISGSTVNSYGEGYAAFTDFQVRSISKEQYGYASTSDRAQKVSLANSSLGNNKFDTESATSDIEHELARLAAFSGVQAGSDRLVGAQYGENDEIINKNPTRSELMKNHIFTGLLNANYASNYKTVNDDDSAETKEWKNALNAIRLSVDPHETYDWWKAIFSDLDSGVWARQPLVMMNTGAVDAKSYGFLAASTSISSNSYQRITMRVKVSAGAKAYIYLTDTSDIEKGFDTRLMPGTPNVTYWYDDEGNLCASDPTAKSFDKKDGILYYLEENGLYTKANDTSGTYYANLRNYEVKDGNLVTKDGAVAFYGKDGAYYTDDTFNTLVHDFPADTPTRYIALDEATLLKYQSMIVVDGTATNSKWVDVSFYVHTGSEAKDYRLEIWAGAREGEESATGMPAGSWFFFDNYKTEDCSSRYESLLYGSNDGTEKGAAGILAENEANLDLSDEKGEKLKSDLALYYTFTFFDSNSYLRYDKTTDTDDLGNPWINYTQSTYSERIIYLLYEDYAGEWMGTPSVSFFLDYSAVDETVTSAVNDTNTDTDTNDEDDSDFDWSQLLLVMSSVILAVVLVAVIIILIARRLMKKYRPAGRPKTAKKSKARAKIAKTDSAAEASEEMTDETPAATPEKDENDPYNE